MTKEGTIIPNAHQGLTVLHTHEGSPLNKEAVAVIKQLGVVHALTQYRYLLELPGLRGLIGHTLDTGTIKLPQKFIHNGAQNVTFKPYR
jgi:hypothetical protein